jgi:oligoendopeptidase F
MIDYFEAVRRAVDERVSELQQEATQKYEEVFDELEAKQQEEGVNGIVPDRESRLRQIRRLDNLAALKSQKSTVNEFRARYYRKVYEAVQEDTDEEERKSTDIFRVQDEISTHELETEDEVKAFVENLENKLLSRVQDDTIVIIE